MRLVPVTEALIAADDQSVDDLTRLLGVRSPPSWPPQFMGKKTNAWLLEKLRDDPTQANWLNYYVIARVGEAETLVGCVGFKGKADANGDVEIGYSIVQELQRRGFASQAVFRLLEFARANGVRRVKGSTLPSLAASVGVFEKCGFVNSGERHDRSLGTILDFEWPPSRSSSQS